jgi:tight adherence protein B
MPALVIVLVTFVACAAIILGIYWLFVVRPEGHAAAALRRRLEGKPVERPNAANDLTKKDAPFSALKALDAALERSGRLSEPVKRVVTDSGLKVSVGALLLACGFVATMTLAMVSAATGSVPIALVLAAAVGSLPYLLVKQAAKRRLKQMEAQLPQAVDMIAVSLRAGHAFTTGLLMVGEELADPLGAEFRAVYDQQRFGKPVPDVLREFADRVPLLDARIFVTAVLTQRETGGNLAEVLDKLAAVIRERFRIRRQVRALSAHGRVTGWVLAFLPPVLALILFFLAPAHIMLLITDPIGQRLMAVAIVLQIIGTLAIRRIADVEF